mgnify:CR=1 FL=1
MGKIKTKAIKSVTVTVLCAIITTVRIILREYKFYAGILFVGIGVGLFAKQMKGLHRKIEEEIGR